MTAGPLVTLNDGNRIPQLGLGVWQVPDAQAAAVVKEALAAGYRSVDTAAIYDNERGVGQGLATSGVPREDVFVTTKVWNSDQGYGETLRAMAESLDRLKLDYVDLYLIHWPTPARDRYLDTWRALVKLKEEGRARSIGVSNFGIPQLRCVIDATGVVPVVNQVELHPYFQQHDLRRFHAEHGIATESWSPLAQGQVVSDPVIAELARKYGKSPAQVTVRWHLESGLVVIPKSVTPARIRENFDVFDFRLDAEDMAQIGALDGRGRIGPDPETFSGAA